jgi:hypothetical protein
MSWEGSDRPLCSDRRHDESMQWKYQLEIGCYIWITSWTFSVWLANLATAASVGGWSGNCLIHMPWGVITLLVDTLIPKRCNLMYKKGKLSIRTTSSALKPAGLTQLSAWCYSFMSELYIWGRQAVDANHRPAVFVVSGYWLSKTRL